MPKHIDVDDYYWGVRRPKYASRRTHSTVVLNDELGENAATTSYKATFAGSTSQDPGRVTKGSRNKCASQVELAADRPFSAPDVVFSTTQDAYVDPSRKHNYAKKVKLPLRNKSKVDLTEYSMEKIHYQTTTKTSFQHNASLKLGPPPQRNMWNRTASKVVLKGGSGLEGGIPKTAAPLPTKSGSVASVRTAGYKSTCSERTTASKVMYLSKHKKTEFDRMKPARAALGNKTQSRVDLTQTNDASHGSHSHDVHRSCGKPPRPGSCHEYAHRRQHSCWLPGNDSQEFTTTNDETLIQHKLARGRPPNRLGYTGNISAMGEMIKSPFEQPKRQYTSVAKGTFRPPPIAAYGASKNEATGMEKESPDFPMDFSTKNPTNFTTEYESEMKSKPIPPKMKLPLANYSQIPLAHAPFHNSAQCAS
ncbi:hypothetical protein BSKO_05141 [Bryopsis sp. KO-2023]|nr:hypothetical protein BSKO_05141 [Bryopsis sp. KO-2023]